MIKKTILLAVAVSLVIAAAFAQQSEDDAVESVREHLKQLEVLAAEREKTPDGEDPEVLNTQISRVARTLRAEITQLVNRTLEAEAAGGEATVAREPVSEILDLASRLTRREIDARRRLVVKRQATREQSPAADHLGLEQQLTRDNQQLDSALSSLLQLAKWKDALSLGASDDFAYLDRVLEERVGVLMARTQLAVSWRNDDTKLLSNAVQGEKAPIEASLQAARESVHGTTASLQATIALMDARELDATAAKELLIEATGSVTRDIFDPGVFSGLVAGAWERIVGWVSENGTQLFFKALFFVAALGMTRVVAGVVRRIATRAVGAPEVRAPQLLKHMVVSMSGKAVMLIGIIIALSQVGINIAPLLAGVGVAGFIVGFALQDTLSNFASGVMILFYHPFDLGDLVEAGGVSGEVHHMNLVSTTIRTFDNQILVVPNNKIWGDVIRNKTAALTRRVDLTFSIGYDDDIAHAERVLREIVDSHELVLDDPSPTIKLHELGDSSVNFIVRPWVNTPDYWNVHWDITRAVKERFDAEGISIPYPQRAVHVHGTAPLGSSETVASETVVPARRDDRERVSATGTSVDKD